MEYLTDQDYKIAEQNGINKENAYQRVYRYGWSVEKAITEPVLVRDGALWERWKDKCESNGISYRTFASRVRLGWSCDRASSELVGVALRRRRGKITEDQIEIAKRNGISESTLRSRVNVAKWPIEKAITLPIGTKLRKRWH